MAGSVHVKMRDATQTTLCVAGATVAANGIEVTFLTQPGDVPLLVVGSVSAGLTVEAAEIRKGTAQRVVGTLPYSYVVDGLTAGAAYTVRVAAYHSLGYGAFTLAAPEPSGVVPATRVPTAPQSLSVHTTTLSSSSLLVVWEEPMSSGGAPITSYRVEWDTSPSFTSACGERNEVQRLALSHTSPPAAGTKYKLTLGDGAAHTRVVDCMDWAAPATDLQAALRLLGGVYATAQVTLYGDDSAKWDYGHTYVVTFVHAVTPATSPFPLEIPLLTVDSSDNTCNDYPGVVSIDRPRFGPGQDFQKAQGKVDNANNECRADLQEPIGKQTISDSVARANGLGASVLQLALSGSEREGSSGHVVLGATASVLCASCVQKMTSAHVITTTTSLVAQLAVGDYFILEEVLVVPSSSRTSATTTTTTTTTTTVVVVVVGRKCVMKTLAVTATTITIDATDAAFAASGGDVGVGVGGCPLKSAVPFDGKAWQIKKFNLRAHSITDLFPGRDYSVRVVAVSSVGESVAAVV